jgi:CRP/FNR family cyclic AMP-dependent transcriptional regulator
MVFSQGDQADAVFYIQKGKVKLAVISNAGKEAIIAILGSGDFLGEECLTGRPLRLSSALMRVLREEPSFSGIFVSYLLSRTIRIEADLVDQLFNSSEKRLARMLLLLANFGKQGKPEPVIAKISQDTLASMNSRVSFFMNNLRKLGFIHYTKGSDELEVHSSLLNIVLHD